MGRRLSSWISLGGGGTDCWDMCGDGETDFRATGRSTGVAGKEVVCGIPLFADAYVYMPRERRRPTKNIQRNLQISKDRRLYTLYLFVERILYSNNEQYLLLGQEKDFLLS
jgi:hypothetical protein